MKRFLIIALTFIFAFSSMPLNTFADGEIKGFEKNYNELFMRNYFTDEEFEKMEQDFAELFDKDIWPELVSGLSVMGGWETSSVEDEYVHRYNTYKPDFDYGILVSVLDQNFLYEYAKKNCMSYLFVGDYFKVIKGRYNNEYTLAGKMTSAHYDFPGFSTQCVLSYDDFESFSKEKLLNLLADKNVTEVIDMKFFGISNKLSFLYIQTPDAEYLLKLHPDENAWDPDLKNIENNKLYPAQEVIGEIENQYILLCNGVVYRELDLSRTKKIYEDEALSLQEEGLLKGNEKGLDLMKPLTRIEAATMLLRAIGKDTTTGGTQTFSDVPSAHWGFNAASKAQELGIVKGIGNNMFAPDRNVSVTEFSTMVLRAAEYGDFDWQKATDILVEKGILTEEQTATMDLFTRGDMAKIIYEARAKGLLN